MAPRTLSASSRPIHTTTLATRPLLRRSRTSVLVCARRGFSGQQSLEQAIGAINRIITDSENRKRKKAEQNGSRAEPEVQPLGKPITFKASARSEKLVKVRSRVSQGRVAVGLSKVAEDASDVGCGSGRVQPTQMVNA